MRSRAPSRYHNQASSASTLLMPGKSLIRSWPSFRPESSGFVGGVAPVKARASVMKPIAELRVDCARIVPVKSAKRQTVVQLHATISHIQRGYGDGVSLHEGFPEREIERGVLRQIVPGILRVRNPVREPRAVVHIRRSEHLPRKSCVETRVQRVSLIMVHRRKSRRYI